MKHPASRAFHARWQTLSLHTGEPARTGRKVASQLASHCFTLADAADAFALRDVGPALPALLGAAAGLPFPDLFAPESRAEITGLLATVADEALPAVAGITARRGQRAVALELTLLPPTGRPQFSGLLVPLTAIRAPRRPALLTGLTVTSWRHLHPPRPPRALRKISVAPGVVLYEGLR